ncbi:TetR/AcrR family transcriptional regulator [Fusobacterium sp. 1001295B_180824_G3]|uniref:TetR/AcrR family transcriptional regulator n=1 Tax=Fusobacterium sp. 1001295B_180824_G3 TaxID=2787123 RepID=UPI001898E6FF|nr:TetR/AcrR family transcriptional regulator [Fusobacterium sp. 1001295B_180824_G3]
MRPRDNKKEILILEATIDLVIKNGLHSLSMSKIAEKTKLSAATIYIYYDNKEDLIEKTYLFVKKSLSEYLKKGISKEQKTEDMVKQFIKNVFDYAKDHLNYLLFIEVCSLNPDIKHEHPDLKYVFEVFENAIKRKDLKNMEAYELMLYCYIPIVQLAKDFQRNPNIDTEARFENICILTWDAIKN